MESGCGTPDTPCSPGRLRYMYAPGSWAFTGHSASSHGQRTRFSKAKHAYWPSECCVASQLPAAAVSVGGLPPVGAPADNRGGPMYLQPTSTVGLRNASAANSNMSARITARLGITT
jgi:hypothetical protein